MTPYSPRDASSVTSTEREVVSGIGGADGTAGTVLGLARLAQIDKHVLVFDRQRLALDSVDETEHARVYRDPECERGYNGGGHTRRLPENAQGVAQLAHRWKERLTQAGR